MSVGHGLGDVGLQIKNAEREALRSGVKACEQPGI
jgi:hypothetical protein